jgi:hypothetical protein
LALVADIDHESEAISHATAPAFMLGAVAAFLSILIARLERIADKNKALRSSDENLDSSDKLAAAFMRRMEILSRAIYFAVLSALATAALLILAFLAGHRARAGRGRDVRLGAHASDGRSCASGARNPRLHGPHAPRVRNFGPAGRARNDRSPVYYDTRGAILKCPVNVDSGPSRWEPHVGF